MARWRRAIELAMTDEEIESLRALSRSRTEPARRVERARMLLAYRETPSFYAVGRSLGTHHQTVERCVERALAYGPLAALDDRPHPGKEPIITSEAKTWLVSLACDKAKEHVGLPALAVPRPVDRPIRSSGARSRPPRQDRRAVGGRVCDPRDRLHRRLHGAASHRSPLPFRVLSWQRARRCRHAAI